MCNYVQKVSKYIYSLTNKQIGKELIPIMKKSLSSETAKLKDNKLIARLSYVTEVFPSLQKEDETLTQLKRAMYGKGLSPLPVIAKNLKGS